MFQSLRSRLWLLFLAFLFLVVASVAITFSALNAQHQDALAINLAGRQRMLTQQMLWLSLTGYDDVALDETRLRFVQTLDALRAGGEVTDAQGLPAYLRANQDAEVERQFPALTDAWKRYEQELARQRATGATSGSAADDVTAVALLDAGRLLVDRLDAMVSRLTEGAQAKVRRLQIVQGAFLLLAVLLLVVAYLVLQRRFVIPLAALDQAAQEMANGDLSRAISRPSVVELDRLAQTLESLRTEVLASRRQLEARVQQRTRELNTAFELSQEIAAQLEITRLLDSVTDRARLLMGGRAAALCLLDDQDGMLRFAAGSGDGQANSALRQPVTTDLPRQVIGEGRTVAAETACSGCGFLRRLPESKCAATPLRVGQQTLGALCVARPLHANFGAEEQAAFALLGNAAAVAIVNARLVEAGRAQAEADAIQVERERLSAELHDNLAQTLGFLNFKVDRLHELIAAADEDAAGRELAAMRGATMRAYGQVRAALTGLQTSEQEEGAFARQLAACVSEIEASTGLQVTLQIHDRRAFDLPAVAQQQVLHIVRESLVNAWRHAQTGAATVTVHVTAGEACFTVRDHGCGFAPERVDATTHLGLTIMRARAERSGGRLRVQSHSGDGTQVCVCYPLAHREDAA